MRRPVLYFALGAMMSAWADASVLPASLPGLQVLDPALNSSGAHSFFDRMADRRGVRCETFRLFLYEDPAQAAQAVSTWLTSQGLSALALSTIET